jgi:hypothetical protein
MMDEAVTDYDAYAYEAFDGLEDAEDEVLLGESTLAKLRAERGGSDDEDFDEDEAFDDEDEYDAGEEEE